MRLGFGCVKLSACAHSSQATSTLKSAFSQGIRWFDTAPLYGQGYSEILLGKFIKTLSPSDRQSIKIVSKFGLGPWKSPKVPARLALPLNHLKKKLAPQTSDVRTKQTQTQFTPKTYREIGIEIIQRQFFGTCERLGLDHIHGYLGHELLPSFLTDDAKKYLENLKTQGRISSLGIGISARHILADETEDFSDFQILQYNGDLPVQNLELIRRFKEKQHIHHSIMKSWGEPGQSAASQLKKHLRSFPEAMTLFSSSNVKHIESNVRAINETYATD